MGGLLEAIMVAIPKRGFILIGLLTCAVACNQAAPSSGGGPDRGGDEEPATEGKGEPPTDDVDPNFDPGKSPDKVDKNGDGAPGDAVEIKEKSVKAEFSADELEGEAGQAVVITIDRKKITSSNDCAKVVESSRFGGDENEGTMLVIELLSKAAKRAEDGEDLDSSYEVGETLKYDCGKGPLSVVMKNLATGHQVELSLTVHAPEKSVFAKAKPFLVLNKTDGEKAIDLEYPTVE